MRALATGLARAEPALCSREAAEISAVTHADPRCVQACVAYTAIVSALVDGAPVGAALRSGRDAVAAMGADEAAGAAAGTGTGTGTGTGEVVAALATPATTGLTELATTGYVVHSLAVAVWAIQQPASLEELLVDVVNRGDDSDTTGAIAGGLLGARDGVSAVPQRWADRLEYAAEIAELAPALHALRRVSGSGRPV
ncbi:conserved hypothetical protein [Parafrankia sp. EUN1f]|nr:conserved hypothetical protein [Parafrankia sp. EUN1f]